MATVREMLKEAEGRLVGNTAARLEAEILLVRALGVDRAFLFAHPDDEVDPGRAEDFRVLVTRRAGGEPVAYITGVREFWSLPIRVGPAVLIPRPETELLVEAALARIPADARCRIADLGTGSGAIALALACERPQCEIHATDISPGALAVARENAARLGYGQVEFHQGSWFEPLSGAFEVVVSNPPYVSAGDPHLDEGDLRFEPDTALVAGKDGMEALGEIVADAPTRLNAGGWLILEHGHDQSRGCHRLLESRGFKEIETLRDLSGTKRVTLGRR